MVQSELDSYLFKTIESALIVEERVPKVLFDETDRLLTALSVKTKRNKEDLLYELTAYKKGVEGRSDLKFVSAKQLPVIKDRMQAMFEKN